MLNSSVCLTSAAGARAGGATNVGSSIRSRSSAWGTVSSSIQSDSSALGSFPFSSRRTGAVQEPHVAGQVARTVLPYDACSQNDCTSAQPLIMKPTFLASAIILASSSAHGAEVGLGVGSEVGLGVGSASEQEPHVAGQVACIVLPYATSSQ